MVEIRPFNRSISSTIFRLYLLFFLVLLALWMFLPTSFIESAISEELYSFIYNSRGFIGITFGLLPLLLVVFSDQKREKRYRKYRAKCDSANYDPGDSAAFVFGSRLWDIHDEISFYLVKFTRVKHNSLSRFEYSVVENLYTRSLGKEQGVLVTVDIPSDSSLINGGTVFLTVRALQCHNYALMGIFDGEKMFFAIPQSINWQV